MTVNQLIVINKDFEFDLIYLFNEYNYAENCDKTKSYYATFSAFEKLRVKRK